MIDFCSKLRSWRLRLGNSGSCKSPLPFKLKILINSKKKSHFNSVRSDRSGKFTLIYREKLECLIQSLVSIVGTPFACVKGKLTSIFMTDCFTLQRFYDNNTKVFKYEKDEGEIE